VRCVAAGEDLAREHHDLPEDQLRHAACAAKRRVEHRDPQGTGGLQVDLVGSDAECANGVEPRHRLHDPPRDLGFAADPEKERLGRREVV
jgi:hypothetical protein